jgi:biotin-(acetyl-CoA carboxylase) ligase
MSPRGGLYMSVIVKPSAPPAALPVLSIMAGYAVATAIQELYGIQITHN